MISSEVQRTLVKSPPELWAEISDPAALAKHLDAFGEIRITRVEPEQRVEWQAPDTSGTVVIKPSGWGTKVKLTVTRGPGEPATAQPAESAPEPLPASASEGTHSAPVDPQDQGSDEAAVRTPDPPAEELDEKGAASLEIEEPELAQPSSLAPEPHPASETKLEPEPRRGFFARLFGRGRIPERVELGRPDEIEKAKETETPEQVATPAEVAVQTPAPVRYNALAAWASQIESEASEPEASVEDTPEPAPLAPEPARTGPETGAPRGDAVEIAEDEAAASAELRDRSADTPAETPVAGDLAVAEVAAVLTGVLDRLGAAHHRPFSRG